MRDCVSQAYCRLVIALSPCLWACVCSHLWFACFRQRLEKPHNAHTGYWRNHWAWLEYHCAVGFSSILFDFYFWCSHIPRNGFWTTVFVTRPESLSDEFAVKWNFDILMGFLIIVKPWRWWWWWWRKRLSFSCNWYSRSLQGTQGILITYYILLSLKKNNPQVNGNPRS